MGNGTRKTILLVEDEAIIAMAERLTLEKNGYSVIIAESGETSVKAVETVLGIDLVLMDINLGEGISGTEAAERILKIRELPLIFLSSHTEREIVDKTEGITSYGYIVKNSGETVLTASLKMAFRLFDAKKKEREREEELRDSEERFRNLYENAPIGIFITTIKGRVLSVNTAMARILGLRSHEEALAYYHDLGVQLYVHKERREEFIRVIAEEGRVEDFEYEAWTVDGRRIWLSMNARTVRSGMEPDVLIQGFTRDITERKRTEEELLESQALYTSFVEQMPACVFRKDKEGRFIFANSLYLRLKGLESADFLGRLPQETVERSLRNRMRDLPGRVRQDKDLAAQGELHHKLIMETGKPLEIEETYVVENGTTKYFHVVKSPVFSSHGEIVGSQGILIEITERKNVENAFRALSARNEAILDSVPDIIMEVDFDKVYTWANREGYAFFGEDVIGKAAESFFVGEQDTYKIVEPLFQGGGDIVYAESWQRRRDGEKRLLAWRCRQLRDPEGKIIGVLSSAQDITEHRRAQEASRFNETRLESLLRISQYPAEDIQDILDLALDEAVSLTSSKIGCIYLYDEEKMDFALTTWSKGIPGRCPAGEDESAGCLPDMALWGEAVRRREPVIVNDFAASSPFMGDTPEERVRLEKFLTVPVFSEGRIVAAVGAANKSEDYNDSDIRQLTMMMDSVWKVVERKRAEGRINALLREKELVLKEIHHRVKNNMGVISGLLSMQANQQENEKDRDILLDAARRVQSMVVLHDRLYRSGAQDSLGMGEFLRSLVGEIAGTLRACPPIETLVRAEDFSVRAKLLSPLGILVNELITNSMKHAFNGRTGGRIEVSASKEGETIRFRYSDDGVGLPESIDLRNSPGFGLKLIDILVQQLGGEVSIERSPGTTFVVKFKA